MTLTEINCPNCQKTIEWSDQFPYRPFCSHRCQLIDLGEWASESYRIPEGTEKSAEQSLSSTGDE